MGDHGMRLVTGLETVLQTFLAKNLKLRRRRFFCCLIVCLSGVDLPANAAAPASAEDANEMLAPEPTEPGGRFTEIFDDGLRAYDAHHYTRAYDLWLSIAKQGDLAAMRNLAHLLRRGMGVQANAEEAAKWYSIAAKRGLTSAQVNLAELFYEGDGVPQSYKLAAQWYARAARAGHAHAQYKLATMIEDGHTSPGNVELAKKLYGWAIDAGHSSALEHYRQLDARKEPVVLETSRGSDEADLDLETSTSLKTMAGAGDVSESGGFLVRKSDEKALVQAQKKFTRGERSGAVTLWRGLALESNSDAQYRLALALLQGQGVRKDVPKAIHWLDIAATGGHPGAAELLKTLQPLDEPVAIKTP